MDFKIISAMVFFFIFHVNGQQNKVVFICKKESSRCYEIRLML